MQLLAMLRYDQCSGSPSIPHGSKRQRHQHKLPSITQAISDAEQPHEFGTRSATDPSNATALDIEQMFAKR
jgi:hypothetical protein